MRGVHAVTDGTPDTVEHDLSAMPRRVAKSLEHQLAEGERIVIRTRQHPVSLWRVARWPALALAVYLWLDMGAHAPRGLLKFALAAVVVALAALAYAELSRRFRWVVVTNKRILIHQGVFDLSVPMMRLTKVTDMTYRRSLLGELTGFGTIIIESAGQQQAIRELTFLPDPDDVNAALNAVIFEEKPRERRIRTQRLRGRLRRGRGGDSGSGGNGGGGGPGGDGGGRGGPGGGPPRGRGPGPRDNTPGGADGGVDVSPAGHPPAPRTTPETWYRSSNLGAPRRLGDTGEIPAVRAEDVDRWRAEGRPGALDAPFDQDATADDLRRPDAQDVREIPLYPPREWVERRP